MKIIGITGTPGAGKGTIVEYLVKNKGFVHYSMSGYITEEIVKKGLPVNRDFMILVANEIRAKHGSSYIADQLYLRAEKNGKDSIIESLRTVAEIDTLKKKGEFYLFAVDADKKTRYERNVKRGSVKDNVTFEKFCEQEKLEMNSTDPNKQNIFACMKLADFTLNNDGTFEELHKKVDETLKKIENKKQAVRK